MVAAEIVVVAVVGAQMAGPEAGMVAAKVVVVAVADKR